MMKKISLVVLAVVCVVQLFAQDGKYTEKLRSWYNEKEYDKVKKYKQKKAGSLAAKSLYYKGMAYYMTQDDRNALKYLDMAIDKGPADHDMYYYKAMAQFFMTRYSDALPNFDRAIALLPDEPAFYASKGETYYRMERLDSALICYQQAAEFENCGAGVFATLGGIHLELEHYPESIAAFKTALEQSEPNTERHQNCSYNIALVHQVAGNLNKAKVRLKEHLILYPDDYHATSKMIQMHYMLEEPEEETAALKQKLFEAYQANVLPDHMRECIVLTSLTGTVPKCLLL